MNYEGVLKARGIYLGTEHNFVVHDDGVATFPIGNPTFTSSQSYPEVGDTSYGSTTGLGITSSTTPSEGFSKVDSWLSCYLLDSPPSLVSGSTTSAVEYIQVAWSLPTQRKLAILTSYVPQISNVKAEIVKSSDNVDKSWTSPNKWSITLESTSLGKPTVTSLKIVLDYSLGFSNLTNCAYTYYGTSSATRISAETSYDIRVYADNDAVISGGTTPRYTYFYGLATLPSGPPGSPTSVSVTSGGLASWTAPTDRDVNSDANPNIAQYQVNVTAVSSQRYGGVLSTHTSPQYTAQVSGSDAATSLSLSTLNPGTTYTTTVQAKNALCVTFGSASSPAYTFTSSLPSAPSWASSSGLTFSNKATLAYDSGDSGYTLDGTALRSLILNYNTMLSTNPRTSSVTTRLNYTVGDTSSTTGAVKTYAGLTGSEALASVTTVGFGTTFVTPHNSDNAGARVYVTSEGDSYSGSSSGFYKQATVYGEAIYPSTNYPSSDSPYSMYLTFAPSGGTTVTTNSLQWYVDGLSGTPTVVAATITDATTDITYVTGVPTFTSSASFSFQTTISNLAHRFLRSDKKHFTAQVETSTASSLSSTLTVYQSNINGSTHSYYAAPTPAYATSTTKHNTSGTVLSVNPGSVQFNDFSLQLTSASSVFNEALQIRVTAVNLQGSSSATVNDGRTNTATGTTAPLRIDTKSVVVAATVGSTLVTCGSDQFPSSGYGDSFDHTSTILGTDQLQLVNGVWSTPVAGYGYKDYSTFFFPGSLAQPDYSSVSSSGFRYVCYKYSNLKQSGTYDTVTVTFTSSGLTLTPSSDSANFRLYVKIVSTSSTVWASGTASINGTGWSAITSNGQGCMDNSSSSVGSIKLYVPTGTLASSTVYVRFGLDCSTSQTLSNISVTAA